MRIKFRLAAAAAAAALAVAGALTATTFAASGPVARLFNHYSLLATAEQLLGLPFLGQAASATTMTSAFNL